MRPRLLGVVLVHAVATSCIVAKDARPELDVGVDVASQYNFRGMPMNTTGVLQPSLNAALPAKGGAYLDFTAWANMDLQNDTGDAWLPDGHEGTFSEIDLSFAYSNQFDWGDLGTGYHSYNWPNGTEFPFGERGATGEVFLSYGKEVVGVYPQIMVRYDVREVDDFYIWGGVSDGWNLRQDLVFDLALRLAWAGSSMAEWLYGLAQGGLADLRVSGVVSYAFSEHIVLRGEIAGSTMVDGTMRDWFDTIGIDPTNAWVSVGAVWSY